MFIDNALLNSIVSTLWMSFLFWIFVQLLVETDEKASRERSLKILAYALILLELIAYFVIVFYKAYNP